MPRGQFKRLPTAPCRGCGRPTTSVYEYCERNPECHRGNKREHYRAKYSNGVCYCLGCGNQLARPRSTHVCCRPECKALAARVLRLLKLLEVNA